MQYQILVLLVVAVAAVRSDLLDANPLVTDVEGSLMEAHLAMGCDYGCKPRIVRPPYDKKNVSTVIQAFTGYRANVALIVDYGTCDVLRTGYFWYIKWGDGTFESGKLDPLLQVQRIHTYPSRCQSYRITAYYCSDYTAVTSTSTFPNCDSYTRCVDVAYDPQFGH